MHPLIHRVIAILASRRQCFILARSYWWEVASLMQRTVLTGWLLLIDHEQQLFRLLTALLISILFLIALLVCRVRLAREGTLVICQRGSQVDPESVCGPIRLRLVAGK